MYYYIKRDACWKNGRPCRKPDTCTRNWSNTSYNYGKSPKFSRKFRTKPRIFTEIWWFRNFLKWQIFRKIGVSGFWLNREIFPKIGASGGRLNRDFWQNHSHRNAWFGGTRILGQRDTCRKSGRSGRKPRIYSRNWCNIPVVPHKEVAEVSKIGNL